jgi:hypothetical protein
LTQIILMYACLNQITKICFPCCITDQCFQIHALGTSNKNFTLGCLPDICSKIPQLINIYLFVIISCNKTFVLRLWKDINIVYSKGCQNIWWNESGTSTAIGKIFWTHDPPLVMFILYESANCLHKPDTGLEFGFPNVYLNSKWYLIRSIYLNVWHPVRSNIKYFYLSLRFCGFVRGSAIVMQ